MLKGAIFDHDGLMFDTEKVWQANWKKEADKLGKGHHDITRSGRKDIL